MDLILTVIEEHPSATLEGVRAFLVGDDGLRGRVETIAAPPAAGQLSSGTPAALRIVRATSAAIASALVTALHFRPSRLELELATRPDGPRVRISSESYSRVGVAELGGLVRQLAGTLDQLDAAAGGIARGVATGAAAMPDGERAALSEAPIETATGGRADDLEADPEDGGVSLRTGFSVDIVSYSPRIAPEQNHAQQRLNALVCAVLRRIGVPPDERLRQATGDGMHVFLPVRTDISVAVPGLLHGMAEELRCDNTLYRDRIRLRMSVVAGTFAAGHNGFLGEAVIEAARLLDSAAIRAAVAEHEAADIVVMLADRVHAMVVRAGYPGLHLGEFQPRRVAVKQLDTTGWLWIPGVRA